MKGSIFTEVYDGIEFDNIEEAVNTSCPICGTPLDWTLYSEYDDTIERVCISGESESCGYTFILNSEFDIYSNKSSYYITMTNE